MLNSSELTEGILRLEGASDERRWPAELVAYLAKTGSRTFVVPKAYGGPGSTPRAQVEHYVAVAAGSLTAALILTQHDAAVELIVNGDNEALRERILPGCASGELLLTVGISQLTTSLRGGKSAMQVAREDGGYRLTGLMPWVTSASQADFVVTAGVLEDGSQLSACVPLDVAGLTVPETMRLTALTATMTGEVHCEGVLVEAEDVVRGPCENVLARRAPVKGLTVSAVGLGMAQALMMEIDGLAERLEGADALAAGKIRPAYEAVRGDVLSASDRVGREDPEIPAAQIRCRVNDLLVRMSATLLTLSKGSGYLEGRRAGKLLRESAFFLVWSAPSAVQMGTLARIWSGRG